MLNTNSERTLDTVEFPPQYAKVPCMVAVDARSKAFSNIKKILKKPPLATLFKRIDNIKVEVLHKLVKILRSGRNGFEEGCASEGEGGANIG